MGHYIQLLAIVILLIWVWMLVDCITNKRLSGIEKILLSGHRKHPEYVIICRQMKLLPLTSTAYISVAQPERRTTVERYLLAAG
jgi:hypothetical protein